MVKLILYLAILKTVFAGRAFVNLGGVICPRDEKALGRCLRDALNTYIPKLGTGLPEFGIPPCEPLLVPAISVRQVAGPITVTSTYSDVTVHGPSTMRIKQIQVNSPKHQVIAKLYIPDLKMRGNYNLHGNILMLPIEGEGKFSATYGDIEALVTIVLGRQPRPNSADALACQNLDVKFQVGHASMELENLFGGDGKLGRTMNKFLNENWQKLAEELQAPMEDALKDFFKPLADHAFATLNADDILSS